MRTDGLGCEILEREECLQLIDSRLESVGRIGFIDAEGLPAILPVNFRLMGDHVVFRTGVGSVANAVSRDQVMAFEVDEVDAYGRRCWSVLVRGTASFLPDDCVSSGPELPRALVPVPGSQIVRIASTLVTGRRFSLPVFRSKSHRGDANPSVP